ncbi:MAG: protein translocase subunit SecF [Candidatus Azosocius agrarius]|nr:MAG: protein translocase subunit SecF [Gammaproteobacteria bacterium]
MDFFKKINNIDFIYFSNYFFKLSIFFCIIFLFIIFFKGINLGLDFKGGLQIEMKFSNIYDIDILKNEFDKLNIKNFTLQKYGADKELLLNISNCDSNNKNYIINLIDNHFNLNKPFKIFEIERSEYIGAAISDKLYDNGSFAIFLAMIFMMMYITFRFNYKFGICAVVALIHDMIILIGVISILNIEFTLIVFSSLLAILGYSINNTVVIFDRIRENINNFVELKYYDFYVIINESVNKTLSRTIMTSFTTLLVIIILMFFGSVSLFYFSFILFLGIIIGTYSSIYIAPYGIYLFSKYTFFIKNVNIDDRP